MKPALLPGHLRWALGSPFQNEKSGYFKKFVMFLDWGEVACWSLFF